MTETSIHLLTTRTTKTSQSIFKNNSHGKYIRATLDRTPQPSKLTTLRTQTSLPWITTLFNIHFIIMTIDVKNILHHRSITDTWAILVCNICVYYSFQINTYQTTDIILELIIGKLGSSRCLSFLPINLVISVAEVQLRSRRLLTILVKVVPITT